MKKLLTAILATGAMTAILNAGCAGTACLNVTIVNVYTQANGEVYIQTSGDESALSCTAPAGAYVHLKSTAAGKNAMYATLLSAFVTKQPITVQLVNGSPTCEISYLSM